jgi:nitroimidazol reductase NimA-like FMN-containing flavoprotein (pyridoxamine 5'-phosphate oxidase superfamily)
VHETAQDLRALQDLLDASSTAAGPHLADVLAPEHRLGAPDLVRLLAGVQILDLATVTEAGRPLVAPVDGLFFRGRFYFGSSPDSVRVRHLRRRPATSAAATRGETSTVIVHGDARFVDLDAAEHAGFRRCLLDTYLPTYGPGWEEFAARAVYARIDPQKMFAATFAAPDAPHH